MGRASNCKATGGACFNDSPKAATCMWCHGKLRTNNAAIRRGFAWAVLLTMDEVDRAKYLTPEADVSAYGYYPAMLVKNALSGRNSREHEANQAWIDEQYQRYINNMSYHLTPNIGYRNPVSLRDYSDPKAEEATTMPRPVIPTITTSVQLSNNREDNFKVADLKLLLEEVARVGGTDESVVSFDQNQRSFSVTLNVTTNTTQREPVLEDEERLALLNELSTQGTTKARQSEIKKLLGI